MAVDPVVGQLLSLPYYAQCSQPGGIGTPALPSPTVGQMVGMFFPGCGHSIRSWDIRQASITGVPTKLICCPVCGFIQAFKTIDQFTKDEIIFA